MNHTMKKTNSSSNLTPQTNLTFVQWPHGLVAIKKHLAENRYQGTWHTNTVDDVAAHVFHPMNGNPTCKLTDTTVVINQSPVSIPLTNILLVVGGKLIKATQHIKTCLQVENTSPYPLVSHLEKKVPIYFVRHTSVDTFNAMPE